jgi:hypothetical protein
LLNHTSPYDRTTKRLTLKAYESVKRK